MISQNHYNGDISTLKLSLKVALKIKNSSWWVTQVLPRIQLHNISYSLLLKMQYMCINNQRMVGYTNNKIHNQLLKVTL